MNLVDTLYEYLKEMVGAFQLNPQPVYASEEERWVKGDDGTVRRQMTRRFDFGSFAHTFQGSSKVYPDVVEAVKNDPVFKKVSGAMVGSSGGTRRFDTWMVINAATTGIFDQLGRINLSRDSIDAQIAELKAYFEARVRFVTAIIPLPGLKSSSFPFVLDEGIVIDELTEEEIAHCVSSNILRTVSASLPILNSSDCVGVRIQLEEPTVVYRAESIGKTNQAIIDDYQFKIEQPHAFGNPSRWRVAELVEDVLFVLRIANPQFVSTFGSVTFDNDPVGSSTSWQTRSTRPFINSRYVLDEETSIEVSNLWRLLKGQAKKKLSLPSICQRRFNAAIDRPSIEDAVVDQLIAAEALFLRDTGKAEERGELGFRLALRVSSFLESEGRNRKGTFKFMRQAYDLRSRVAHGGPLPNTVKMVGRGNELPISEFVDELSMLMRLSLRKAIELYPVDKSFGSPDYWEQLLFDANKESL